MNQEMNQFPKFLHRYTSINELRYLLRKNAIKFSNWKNWPDENDKELLKIYKSKINKSVFVYCLTSGSESIHHWSAYANKNGCRLKFNLDIINSLIRKNNIIARPVSYIKQSDLTYQNLTVQDLPFLKRFPYKVENEFRLVKIRKKDFGSFSLNVGPEIINKISLSPFNTEAYNERLMNSLIKKHPYLKNKFSFSKVNKYENWINYFRKNI
jgi:hypothetical protein